MARHTGESVATWFNGLFTTVIGISTLGASITFSYVIGTINPPPSTSSSSGSRRLFGITEVQLFLGISWLLFLLALAFASLGSTILTFFKDHWKEDWDGLNGKTSQRSVQMYATFSTGLLGGLLIAAFIFLCLVVTAYSPVIGWLALGFTALFGFGILASVVIQAPWPWQDNTPRQDNTMRQHDTPRPKHTATA